MHQYVRILIYPGLPESLLHEFPEMTVSSRLRVRVLLRTPLWFKSVNPANAKVLNRLKSTVGSKSVLTSMLVPPTAQAKNMMFKLISHRHMWIYPFTRSNSPPHSWEILAACYATYFVN